MDWLVDLRALDDTENAFEVVPPNDRVTMFGSYQLACAVRGAAATVEGMELHSLQATFLTSIRGEPFRLEVEETRSGRSIAVRRVVLRQEAPCAVMTVAFHAPEPEGSDAPEWHGPATAPAAPPAASLERFDTSASGLSLVDLRPVAGAPEGYARLHPMWARPGAPFGDGPVAAAAAIALASDQYVIALATPHEEGPPQYATTLDHSVWWHRRTHADEWLLYDAELLTLSEGRGVARGTVHDANGRLVASYVQEVMRRGVPERFTRRRSG